MTEAEALIELMDMGVDHGRIQSADSMVELYETIMQEVSDFCAERGIE
jgi:hypothetical protein